MASQPVNSFETYEGKNAGEVFLKPVITTPAIADMGIKVIEDIQSKLYMNFATKLDKVTKKRVGCTSTVTGDGVAITRRAITVVDFEVYLEQCADVFDQTVYEAAKKKGVEINDLEGTDIENLLMEILTPTVYRDMLRIAWFGDTSLAGDTDYNAVDGFLELIEDGVTAATIANVVIASMTTGQHAHDELKAVWLNQKNAMKAVSNKDKVFLVDRNIFELYGTFLSTLGTDEISHSNLVNGQEVLKFQGIPVIPMDIWTEYFEADFPNGLGNGRIILAVKDEALVLGVDASSDYTQVKFWYDINDDVNKTRVRYKMGPTLKHHDFLSVAGFGASSNS